MLLPPVFILWGFISSEHLMFDQVPDMHLPCSQTRVP